MLKSCWWHPLWAEVNFILESIDKLNDAGDVVHKFILIFLLFTIFANGIGQTRIFLLSIDCWFVDEKEVTMGIFCTFSRREPIKLKIKWFIKWRKKCNAYQLRTRFC